MQEPFNQLAAKVGMLGKGKSIAELAIEGQVAYANLAHYPSIGSSLPFEMQSKNQS